MAAIDHGHVDFVALGRSLLADPDWPDKVRDGRAVRRCIACNSCVDGMRGGGRLHCLVNPVAGRERAFASAAPPSGERIAVIGAGPAGLSYASLVADRNRVTVFERGAEVGGAFRLAGKAPLFQQVEADEAPLLAYVRGLERACREQGVEFRYGVDVRSMPESLESVDRVVIATGARYRFGLGPVVRWLLERGAARRRLVRRLLSSPTLRYWFYYQGRKATGRDLMGLARPGQKVVVIGDALRAGKSAPAILSAFEAALLDHPGPSSASSRPGSA
jgi:threonine dehydrogenase-like Zn-dependent dehydrogenase